MSTYGWNAAFTNGRWFGRDQSRSYGSNNQSGLACRICHKVYMSSQALIEHYESHQDDFVPQRQNHQRTQVQPYQRGDVNLGDNPFHHRNSMISALQQRYHPYFPNGYRNPVANANSSFLVPTQNPQPYQGRTYPVGNNSTLPVSMAGTSQFAVMQPVHHDGGHVPHLQLASTSMNRNNATLLHPPLVPGGQKLAPSLRIENQKGYDESGDKRTIWYLGQLDHPIPEIIDLESGDEGQESPKFNQYQNVRHMNQLANCILSINNI